MVSVLCSMISDVNEIFVRFVDIDRIVDYHCLIVHLIIFKSINTKEQLLSSSQFQVNTQFVK